MKLAKSLLIALTCLVSAPIAVAEDPTVQPDTPSIIDSNGVNLFTGALQRSIHKLHIGGEDASGLTYVSTRASSWSRSNKTGIMCDGSSCDYGDEDENYIVVFGNKNVKFEKTSRDENIYVSKSHPLTSLEEVVVGEDRDFGDFVFTDVDGSTYKFTGDEQRAHLPSWGPGRRSWYLRGLDGYQDRYVRHAQLDSITFPNGIVIDGGHSNPRYTSGDFERPANSNLKSNLGYALSYEDSRSLFNLGHVYCDVEQQNCADLPSINWPNSGDSLDIDTWVCDAADGCNPKEWRHTTEEGVLVSYGFDYTDTNLKRIESVKKGSYEWTYDWESCSGKGTHCFRVLVTSPDGVQNRYFFDKDGNLLQHIRYPSNGGDSQTTIYTHTDFDPYDPLLTSITYPEGNSVNYTYDGVGRITEVRKVAKPGSGVPDMVTSYTYVACNHVTRKYCAKPSSVTDERGKTTLYTYASQHGGVTAIRHPWDNGRNRTDIKYGQFHAWYRTSSSATQVQDPRPVWRKTKEIGCYVTDAEDECYDGDPDATVTQYVYEPGHASKPSNINLEQVIVRSGDSSTLATTTYVYDTWGRVRYEDGPLAGEVDMVWYEYDKRNNVTLETRFDPDGAGPQRFVYTKYTYNLDDQITLEETGWTTGFNGTRSYTPLTSTGYEYDVHGRLSKVIAFDMNSGHVSLTQTSYDASSRVDCVALRMDMSTYSSLPASACTQTASGQDRITKTEYDAYGRAYKTTNGLGTSVQMSEQRSFTNNGLEQTVQDGNGNLTTYVYDGLDRLTETRFPNKTGSGSSTADVAKVTYEVVNGKASPLISTEYKRAHTSGSPQQVSFTYDAMGRVKTADATGTVNDVTTTYDTYGNIKTLTKNGKTITYVWDALGRLTSETTHVAGQNRTVSYLYDAAGRRTRVTYPDGFYVTYDYDTSSAAALIKENGATTLATYSKDAFTRSTALNRGNGTSTSVGYDTASRLKDLDITLPSAASYNQQIDYAYNTAGQITSKLNSNSDYLPTIVTASKTYGVNGLNQVTNESGVTFSYDANGNLTNDGSLTYTYDMFNRLTSASNGSTLAYDAAGRLYSITAGSGATTYFVYDGAALIAEYSSNGTLLRRYVHGIGVDKPIVWYEGAAVNSGTRRYLIPDERGSIALVTNNTGTVINRNKYDEYGVPDAANLGRFSYTGQIWLDEVDLYYYKARLYNPRLGRFMQTDPIGYGDGLNMYAYVGNDPINGTDPSGTVYCDSKASESQCAAMKRAAEGARKKLLRAEANLRAAAKDPTSEIGKTTTKQFEVAYGKGTATTKNLNKLADRFEQTAKDLAHDSSTRLTIGDLAEKAIKATASYKGRISANGGFFDKSATQEDRSLWFAHEGDHYSHLGSWHHPEVRARTDTTTGSRYISGARATYENISPTFRRNNSLSRVQEAIISSKMGDPAFQDCFLSGRGC